MSLQTTHNTTTTSLQRELDQLRQEHQQTKVRLRELEMGNDDLERNERAVSSSLADMETKYSKTLEEKILLEHELLEKAGLEEETQRLKDELRGAFLFLVAVIWWLILILDANVEISILREQLNGLSARKDSSTSLLVEPQGSQTSLPSTENLLDTAPPPNLDSTDISPATEPSLSETVTTTPKASALSRPAVPSPFMPRIKSTVDKPTPLKNTSNLLRTSTTLPSLSSPTTASPRGLVKPTTVPKLSSLTSVITTSSSTGSIAKNKGVQMVSEMRARVRNLEQKIHTRVPRLRMASSTRQSLTSTPISPIPGTSSPSSMASNGSTAKTSLESQRRSVESRRYNDSPVSNASKKSGGDSSGWVLIMEDSPSPQKNKIAKGLKEKRRLSNGTAPTSFRPAASTVARSTSPSLSTGPMNPLSVSTGVRRPQSRHSGGGPSTARPQTPTFLPVPSNSLSTSTVGMKRSTGPGSTPYSQMKRSSLGKPAVPVPPLPTSARERPITMPPTGYTGNYRSVSPIESKSKALPNLPDDLTANVTIRPSSRMPSSTSGSSILTKSRIGRPSGGISGRRSGGAETHNVLDITDLVPPSRSPSAN